MCRIALISLILVPTLAVPGSAQTPVTVYEDEGGVPHIIGATDAAVLWALGRQHMLDFPVSTAFHLWYASAVVANRTAVGTTRLMVIEFTASGPEVSYLAPVGMTEIATDPRRYLPAQDFVDRQTRPLHFVVATITSPAHVIGITPLVMPP